VADRAEYLLRPDLGRRLSDEAKATIAERCTKGPQVQIVVGDGLSAAAIDNNLAKILPVIQQGLTRRDQPWARRSSSRTPASG
jgi:ethanolamine ammonia-lyase small subunit